MSSYPQTSLHADAAAAVLPLSAGCGVDVSRPAEGLRRPDAEIRAGKSSDTHFRSLVKAISWRCVGTVDTFIVSFAVLTLTGAAGAGMGHAARVSGGIAAVEVVTKILLYYLHERAWARVKLGRAASA